MSNPASALNQPQDVLIVGGGSAGATLAARLSEDPNRRVLLLEAGPAFASDAVPGELGNPEQVPAPNFDWGYTARGGASTTEMAVPRGARTVRQLRSERGRRDTCTTPRRGIMANSRRRGLGVGRGPRNV